MKARVTYGLAKTINTGNFENSKVHCEVTVECSKEEVDDAYKYVRQFVHDSIKEEVARLKGQLDD